METVYEDYSPKGVKFLYIYKALAHPELNGYVKPFTLDERLMHVKEAQRTLGSKITWIADSMSNDIKHALGNRENSEFVIDPDGKIVRMRSWSNPEQLRKDLTELVGPVENPTQIADLDMKKIEAPKAAASGVVSRIEKPGRMQPIKIKPKIGLDDTPFYAKLRVEVEPQVLRTGAGKMYIGFHMDPIYHVHWNNLVEPIRYELKAAKGTIVSPTSGKGPEVKEASDIDPREFLVDIENGKSGEPIELTAYYFACNDSEGWCKPVTQRYTIYLERDRDGGRVRRGGDPSEGRGFFPGGERGFPGRRGDFMAQLLDNDKNGDGKISKEEAPERFKERFDFMDGNGDGFIDKDELEKMAQRFRGRGGPGGRGRGRANRRDNR